MKGELYYKGKYQDAIVRLEEAVKSSARNDGSRLLAPYRA